MGFSSTLISQSWGFEYPEWFKEKYAEKVSFPRNYFHNTNGLVASKVGSKYYNNEFFEDYYKVLQEVGFFRSDTITATVVVLGEDGYVTKVEYTKAGIRYVWMQDGYETDHVWRQGWTMNLYDYIRATVKIRRGPEWIVKPEAEQLDGNTYNFEVGWEIEGGQYPEEFALLPQDDNYPDDGPIWIASGDVINVEPLECYCQCWGTDTIVDEDTGIHTCFVCGKDLT